MSEEYASVKVEQGVLRGGKKSVKGLYDVTYYSFMGIPFAKPPVGELRFKAPQPPEPWEGVRDALEEGGRAPQSLYFAGGVTGKEDCLYLNVFTPELPSGSKPLKPVLFHIHGGGFYGGHSGMCLPDYFIGHDIVNVASNYRIGALGFLSLENDEVSGNSGLKDQVQALQWVQKNIKQFGGDPNNVTIMGLSAGGTSVDYLILSDLTKGLFRQAVVQSGSALTTPLYQTSPRELAVRLACSLGYSGDTKDDRKLEIFLKSCNDQDIVQKQHEMINIDEKVGNLSSIFTPCTEKPGKGLKFITKKPRDIYESGKFNKVPVITGYTNGEGSLLFMGFAFSNVEDYYNLVNNNWDFIIPLNMAVPKEKRAEAAKEIMQYYFNCKPLTTSNADQVAQYVGDIVFSVSGCDTMKYLLQYSDKPVFLYGVTYDVKHNFIRIISDLGKNNIELKGVPHGGDLQLLYNLQLPDPKIALLELTENDKTVALTLTTMIANFAKTGNPNYEGIGVKWEAISTNKIQHLDIGQEFKMTEGRLHEERMAFWDRLYSKYGYLF